MGMSWCGWGGLGLGGWLLLLACAGEDEARPGDLPSSTTVTSTTNPASVSVGGTGNSVNVVLTSTGNSAGGAGPLDPCDTTECGDGQRCENQADMAVCVGLTCEELACDD